MPGMERYPQPTESDIKPQINDVVLTNYDYAFQDEGMLAGSEKFSAEHEKRGLKGKLKRLKHAFFRQPILNKHIKEARSQVKSNTKELILESGDVEAAAAEMSLKKKPFIDRKEINAIRDAIALDEDHEYRLGDKYVARHALLESKLQDMVNALTTSGNRSKIAPEVNIWVDDAIEQLPQFYQNEDKEVYIQQITQSVVQIMDGYEKAVAESGDAEAIRKVNLHLGGRERNGGKTRARVMLEELGTNPLVWTGASIAAKALMFAPVVGGVLGAFRKHRSVKADLERTQLERRYGKKGPEGKYRQELSATFAEQVNASDLIEVISAALAKTNVEKSSDADPAQLKILINSTGLLQAINQVRRESTSYNDGMMHRQRLTLLKMQAAAEIRLKNFGLNALVASAKAEGIDKLNELSEKQEKNQLKLRRKKALKSGLIVGGISLVGVGLQAIPDEWAESAVDKLGDGAQTVLAHARPFQTVHAATSEHNPIQYSDVGEPAPFFTDVQEIINHNPADGIDAPDVDAEIPDVNPEADTSSLWQELINQQDQRDVSLDKYISYEDDSIGELNELELEYYPEAGGDGVVIDISSMASDADGDGVAEFPDGDQMYAVFYLNAEDHAVGNEIRIPIPEDGKLIINEDNHPELLPLFENSNGHVEQQFSRLSIASENSDGSFTFYASNVGENVPQEVVHELQQSQVPVEEMVIDGEASPDGVPPIEDEESPDPDIPNTSNDDSFVNGDGVPIPDDEAGESNNGGMTVDGEATPDDIPSDDSYVNGEGLDQESDYIPPIVPMTDSGLNPGFLAGLTADKRAVPNSFGRDEPAPAGGGGVDTGINKFGGVGNKPYGPHLLKNGMNTQGGVGKVPYGPTLRTNGINSQGGVGNNQYGPNLTRTNGINTQGGVGNRVYGPNIPAEVPSGAAAAAPTNNLENAGQTPNGESRSDVGVDISIKSGRDTIGSGNNIQGNNNTLTVNNGINNEVLQRIYDDKQNERTTREESIRDERSSRVKESEIAAQERIRTQEIQSQSTERMIKNVLEVSAASSNNNFEILATGLKEVATGITELTEEMARMRQEFKAENNNDSSKEILLAALASNAEMLKTLAASQQRDIDAIKYIVDAALKQPNDELKLAFDALLEHIKQGDKQWSELLTAIKNDAPKVENPDINIKITNIQNANTKLRPNLRVVLSQNFREAQRARRRTIPRRGPLPRAGRVGNPEPGGPNRPGPEDQSDPGGPEEPTGPGNPGGPTGPQGPGPEGRGGPGVAGPQGPGPENPPGPEDPTNPGGPSGPRDGGPRPTGPRQPDSEPPQPGAEAQPKDRWRGFTDEEIALGRERSAAALKEDFLVENSEGRHGSNKIRNIVSKGYKKLRTLYPERYNELRPMLREKIDKEFNEPWMLNNDPTDKAAESDRRQWLEQLYDDNFYRELAGDPPIEPENDDQPGSNSDSDQSATGQSEQSTDNDTRNNNDAAEGNQDSEAPNNPDSSVDDAQGANNNDAEEPAQPIINSQANQKVNNSRNTQYINPADYPSPRDEDMDDISASNRAFRSDINNEILDTGIGQQAFEDVQQARRERVARREANRQKAQAQELAARESKIIDDFSKYEELNNASRENITSRIKSKLRQQIGEERLAGQESNIEQRLNQFFERWGVQGETTPDERRQWLQDAFSGQLIKDIIETEPSPDSQSQPEASNDTEPQSNVAQINEPDAQQSSPEAQQASDPESAQSTARDERQEQIRSTVSSVSELSTEDQDFINLNFMRPELSPAQADVVRSTLMDSLNQSGLDSATIDRIGSSFASGVDRLIARWSSASEQNRKAAMEYVLSGRMLNDLTGNSTPGAQENQSDQKKEAEPTAPEPTGESIDGPEDKPTALPESKPTEARPNSTEIKTRRIDADIFDTLSNLANKRGLTEQERGALKSMLRGQASLMLFRGNNEVAAKITPELSKDIDELADNWEQIESPRDRIAQAVAVATGPRAQEILNQDKNTESTKINSEGLQQDDVNQGDNVESKSPSSETQEGQTAVVPRTIDERARRRVEELAQYRRLTGNDVNRLKDAIIEQTTKALRGLDRQLVNKIAPLLSQETDEFLEEWNNIARPSDRIAGAEQFMSGVRAQELLDQLNNSAVEDVLEGEVAEPANELALDATESSQELSETATLPVNRRQLNGKERNYVDKMPQQESLSPNNIETLINQSKAAMEASFNEDYRKYQNELVTRIEEELSYWDSATVTEREQLIESMFNGDLLHEIADLNKG